MPSIYVSDDEMKAIEYFQGLVHFLSEGPVSDEWMKEYSEHCSHFSKLESKFLKAKKAESSKRLIASTLKKIEQSKK